MYVKFTPPTGKSVPGENRTEKKNNESLGQDAANVSSSGGSLDWISLRRLRSRTINLNLKATINHYCALEKRFPSQTMFVRSLQLFGIQTSRNPRRTLFVDIVLNVTFSDFKTRIARVQNGYVESSIRSFFLACLQTTVEKTKRRFDQTIPEKYNVYVQKNVRAPAKM